MGASRNALPRGVRLGRVALFCSAAALALQPVELFIALRGVHGPRIDHEIFLALSLAILLSLAGTIVGVVSVIGLRGAPDKARLPGLLGLVLGVCALVVTVVVGVFSLLMASNGAWIYMS